MVNRNNPNNIVEMERYHQRNMDIDHIMYCVEFVSLSILWSYSLHLMLEHNSSEYYKFLQFLQKVCCYCDIIGKDEMEQFSNVERIGNNKIDKGIDSIVDTTDIRIKTAHTGNEMSVVTVTEV